MSTPRGWPAVFLVCALSGCALLRPAPPPGPPPLTAPKAFGKILVLRQQVEIQHKNKTRKFNTLLQIKPDKVTTIWFGTLGARLFSIAWDGRSLCVKSPGGHLPGALSPAWLLADIQAVYAPLPALQRALTRSGWQIAQTHEGERVLAFKGEKKVAIEYAQPGSVSGKVIVQHSGLDLRITIHSKRLKPENRNPADKNGGKS